MAAFELVCVLCCTGNRQGTARLTITLASAIGCSAWRGRRATWRSYGLPLQAEIVIANSGAVAVQVVQATGWLGRPRDGRRR